MALRFQLFDSSTSRMICRSGSSSAFFQRHAADTRQIDAGAAGHVARQITGGDGFFFAQQYGPFHDILQFANVPRPGVRFERRRALLR